MLANEGVPCNSVGQVVLKLKTAWRDGTTHILMSPLEFMQRLPALVHRQRLHFRTTASRRSILPIRCPDWVGSQRSRSWGAVTRFASTANDSNRVRMPSTYYGLSVKNRRKLVVALGASRLLVPFGSFAQTLGKVWRVGFLTPAQSSGFFRH